MLCSMSMVIFLVLITPLANELGLEPWQAGGIITFSSLAWLLMARVWGALSDRYGRRNVILLSVMGLAISDVALASFFVLSLSMGFSGWAAFVGITVFRFLACAAYISLPTVSYALVADVAVSDERVRLMSRIGAANGVGNVLGAFLVVLFGGGSVTEILYLVCVLPFFSFVVLYIWCPAGGRARHEEKRGGGLSVREIGFPLVMAFVSMLSVTMSQVTIGYSLGDVVGGGRAGVIGYMFMAAGLGLILGQFYVGRSTGSLRMKINVGALLAFFGYLFVCFASSVWMLGGAFCVIGCGVGILLPIAYNLVSNVARCGEQGRGAGYIGIAQGSGYVLGPLMGGVLYSLFNQAPYLLSAFLFGSIFLFSALVSEEGFRRQSGEGTGEVMEQQ
ncbi:MFS transporter [Pseudomonas aeruginosa]|uniref:MFS transporter n=1 Tax=Pseudomonas aeruginosa TaxID=287 RepID=UPI003A101443